MKKSLIGIALSFGLVGCSALGLQPIGVPTISGLEKYTPPTAQNLAPACQVASPTADDTNACDLYKVNYAVCNANLSVAEAQFEALLTMFNPGVGVAASGAVTAINATEAWWCKDNGYYVTVKAMAPPALPSVTK